MYRKVDPSYKIAKRHYRKSVAIFKKPTTIFDDKMFNLLFRGFNQLIPLLSSNHNFFESAICDWADSIKSVLKRCTDKRFLYKYVHLYKTNFIRILGETYVEYHLKHCILDIWLNALDKIPPEISKKIIEEEEETFVQLMQNTLQHIGNFDLQNRIVIIFIKYISLLEYNEKNILTEKIFTDKEVLNFFKAIQTYEDESNIRQFINHYNSYRGLDNVFSIEAKHVSLMDIDRNEIIELSVNSRQFWIDFNKSSDSIDFWASKSNDWEHLYSYCIKYHMISNHEIETSTHTLILYLNDNIISESRLENIGNFDVVRFTFPDEQLFDYLLLQIIEPKLQIMKTISKKTTNYIDYSTTEVELTDVYDIDDLLPEKPKRNEDLTIANAVKVSGNAVEVTGNAVKVPGKNEKISNPREDLIITEGSKNINKKPDVDLMEIDNNIVSNFEKNMPTAENIIPQNVVTEKKSAIGDNNNKSVIHRKKKLTKNLPKKNKNIESKNNVDSETSLKSTEKSIGIIEPTKNNISMRNQTGRETNGMTIKSTGFINAVEKKNTQILGKENKGTGIEQLYDGLSQSAKDRQEYQEITNAINEITKINTNYPTHSYRAYKILSQVQNKKKTENFKPPTAIATRKTLPRKTKPLLLYDHSPDIIDTEKNYDESSDSKISKSRQRQNNKKNNKKNMPTVHKKANIKSIKKNKDKKLNIPDMRTVISNIRSPLGNSKIHPPATTKTKNIVNNHYDGNDKNISLCDSETRFGDPINNEGRQTPAFVNERANKENSSLHVEDTSSKEMKKINISDMGNSISNIQNPSGISNIQASGIVNIANNRYDGDSKNINLCVPTTRFGDPKKKDYRQSPTFVNDTPNVLNSSLHVENTSYEVNDEFSRFLSSFDINTNEEVSKNMLQSTTLAPTAPTINVETTETINANEEKNIPNNDYFEFKKIVKYNNKNATNTQLESMLQKFNDEFSKEWILENWFQTNPIDSFDYYALNPLKESCKRKLDVERHMPKKRKLTSCAKNLTSDSPSLPLTSDSKNSMRFGTTFPTERATHHSTEEENISPVLNKSITLKHGQKIDNVDVTSDIVKSRYDHNITNKKSLYNKNKSRNPADIEEWQKGDKQKMNDCTITKFTKSYGENLTLKFKNRYTGLVKKLQMSDGVKVTANTKEKFKKMYVLNAKARQNMKADMQYQNSYKIEMEEYEKLIEKREELSKILLGSIVKTAEQDKLGIIDAKQKIAQLKHQLDEKTEHIKRKIRKNYVDDFCDIARKLLAKYNK